MTAVKTAISLEETLYNMTESLAKSLHLSRSQLVSKALQELIEREHNRALLASLDEAYRDPETREEKRLRQFTKRYWQNRKRATW